MQAGRVHRLLTTLCPQSWKRIEACREANSTKRVMLENVAKKCRMWVPGSPQGEEKEELAWKHAGKDDLVLSMWGGREGAELD